MELPACSTSTYQPQPWWAGEPSRSHDHGPPSGALTLHRDMITTPAAATRISVPRGTAMSTPWWEGRSMVRKPETRTPLTGTVQPDAAISPGFTHWRLARLP